MPDPSHLIVHWGYPAIFFLVFFGNLGLPVPEESVLMLVGFLAWKGDVKFGLPLPLESQALYRATTLDTGSTIGMEPKPRCVIGAGYSSLQTA